MLSFDLLYRVPGIMQTKFVSYDHLHKEAYKSMQY